MGFLNFKIKLVGAGQIGSRYLQGLAKCNTPLEIFVNDHNVESLQRAKTRWQESINKFSDHKIIWNNKINNQKDLFDLIIVSTSSYKREYIVSDLSKNSIAKFWIIEKVLAQSTKDIKKINYSTNQAKSVWVNTPRRIMKIYFELKKLTGVTPNKITYKGGMWGMACNSIHFIDLVEFLTNQSIVTVDTSNVDKKWIHSKRPGYYEITGELLMKFSNGTELILQSSADINNKFIKIELPNKEYWIIDETNGKLSSSTGEEIFGKLENQSDITPYVVQKILKYGKSDLTTLKDSSRQHSIYLDAILEHWNKSNNKKDKKVPIT